MASDSSADIGATAGRAASCVHEFDWELLEFVIRWQPYGGPPEDETLVRFGMAHSRLHARFREIVAEITAGCDELSAERESLLLRARALIPSIGNPALPAATAESGDAETAPGAWVVRHGVRYWRRAG